MDSIRAAVFDIHSRYRKPLEPLPSEISPRLSAIHGIKTVLFDIYGTLLISGSGDVGTAFELSRKEAFQRAIDRAGLLNPQEAAVRKTEELFFGEIKKRHAASRQKGINYPEVEIVSVWSSVLRGLSLQPTEEQCIQAAVTYEALANPVYLMPGAPIVIDELKQAGFHLGIVSNAQSFTAPLLEYELGSTLLAAGFESSLCSYSYLLGEAKPSTAIFRPVLESLANNYGILPPQVIYVGNDMLNDVYTATRLGLKTCLFAGDSRSLRLREDHKLCRDTEPDVIVSQLTQIAAVVSP